MKGKNDKIKILQFPIANTNGGITHYALNNWKWMDKEKFHCDFATMSGHLEFEDEVLATGSKIYHISCYAEENRKQFIKEFDEILSNGYDVVHLHTKQWKSFLAEELCKKHHLQKVIVHSHSTGIDTLNESKRIAEIKLHEQVKKEFNESMATDFWACSYLAAEFLFGEQIAAEKIKIMPNAIDLDKFSYHEGIRDKYREKYSLKNCYVIGNVGRFAYQKNHAFLIDVFHEVSKEIENTRLVLIGDGVLLDEIKKKVSLYGLEDKVLFLGKRDDVSSWYQAMDVFCLPSRFEGLPISMIEAQAAGLQCICSDNITEEIVLTDNIHRIPLEVSKWKDEILKRLEGYQRKDMTETLTMAGYNILYQIKEVEKEYANII